ncbi:hypothetical protein Ae201684P_020534 [Aphanomyces euteiches]|uniref:Uncharacterized protein n=1 Tax=Aphanomyces euteiches TaxID=100861 RepID=A0A6G0WH96_9STRA|nr:hypothetical protein Ae201684_015177 [Aphanomyces euteiches]KAH9079954.1 hypothetical protein Ae201684P_020534 [Aphanomyces euteiches]
MTDVHDSLKFHQPERSHWLYSLRLPPRNSKGIIARLLAKRKLSLLLAGWEVLQCHARHPEKVLCSVVSFRDRLTGHEEQGLSSYDPRSWSSCRGLVTE